MHNVKIQDDNDNWVRWGNLIHSWITTPGSRPTNVGQLRSKMAGAAVAGIVKGADNRGVTFVDYSDTGPIIIPLPSVVMVGIDDDLLDWISLRPPGQRRYPLPAFYAIAFGGASTVDLANAEIRAMARRRLGEYVINECM